MSDIQIIGRGKNENQEFVKMRISDKRTVTVAYDETSEFTAVWVWVSWGLSFGKFFETWEDALDHYKLHRVVAAITIAREEFARIDAEEAQEDEAIDLAEEAPVESDPVAAWEAISAEVHTDEFSKRMKEGDADEVLDDYFAREDAAKEQLKQAAWEKTKHVNHKETIMGLSMDAPSDLNWVLGVLSS